MKQRVALVATAMMLFAVACTSDTTSTSLLSSSTTPNRAATVTAPDAAPVSLTIFPSTYVTNAFTPMPTGTVAPAAPASFDRTFHLTSSNPALLSQLPATVVLP